jgi:hypothetical protein
MLLRFDDLGADDRGEHTAGHDQRDGAGTRFGSRHLGRSEAQVLGDAEAQAGKDGADAVDLEVLRPDTERECEAAEQRADATEPEARLAAQAGEHNAGRDRCSHGCRHLDRHRQRVERLIHR